MYYKQIFHFVSVSLGYMSSDNDTDKCYSSKPFDNLKYY